MRRLIALILTLLLPAACVRVTPPPPASPALASQCRATPDGGPPLADRGIGGTGAPLTREADRGIGGTGIAGVIQGFASICVNDLEVAVDRQVPVEVDGQPSTAGVLRVGQFVAITTAGGDGSRAEKITARHEVVGPVEEVVSVHPALAVVAGQRVRIPSTATGDAIIQPGTWVAVSGLRGPDGDIIASRVDSASPGRVLVRGPLIVADGVPAIGSIPIQSARDTGDQVETYVVASGTYVDGTLVADTITPDLLVSNPPAYFGPETKRLVVETTARYDTGAIRMAGGYRAAAAPEIASGVNLNGPSVITLQARPDGSFAVINAHAGPKWGPPSMPASPGTRPGRGAANSPAAGASAANTRVVTIEYQISPAAGGAGSGLSTSEVVTLAARPDGSITPISATSGVTSGAQASASGGDAPAAASTSGAAASPTRVVTVTTPYGTSTSSSGASSSAGGGGSAVVTLAERPDGSFTIVRAASVSDDASGRGANAEKTNITARVATGPAPRGPLVVATPIPAAGGGASLAVPLGRGQAGGWAGKGAVHSGTAGSSMAVHRAMGLRPFSPRFKFGR